MSCFFCCSNQKTAYYMRISDWSSDVCSSGLSYKPPREMVWMLGLVIFRLMMATAFMGYVLPWGQMSFWGATVITNLFSAIPIVGESIVHWLLGGFADRKSVV